MGALGVVLLVAFVIVCIFSVLIVLVQGEPDGSMGGLMGGQNSAVFGARSANVLTKATYVLVTLFFLGTVGLALVYKTDTPSGDLKPVVSAAQNATQKAEGETQNIDWVEAEMQSLSGDDSASNKDEASAAKTPARKEVSVEDTFLKETAQTQEMQQAQQESPAASSATQNTPQNENAAQGTQDTQPEQIAQPQQENMQ